jgi:light-regulated signal transduction histidine kinase (bacteriophytochrome)
MALLYVEKLKHHIQFLSRLSHDICHDLRDKNNLSFERFQQTNAPDVRQHEETGLGQAIGRDLVQLHRGKIWVESMLRFTIPLSSTYLSLLRKAHATNCDLADN